MSERTYKVVNWTNSEDIALYLFKLEKIKKDMELLREENQILRERINKIAIARKESDDIMNKLFDDSEFKTLLTQKLKKLKL